MAVATVLRIRAELHRQQIVLSEQSDPCDRSRDSNRRHRLAMEGDRPDARLDTTAADAEQARYAHQATLLLCSWHPHLADDNGFPRLRGRQDARPAVSAGRAA
jgi:hypothetical protein